MWWHYWRTMWFILKLYSSILKIRQYHGAFCFINRCNFNVTRICSLEHLFETFNMYKEEEQKKLRISEYYISLMRFCLSTCKCKKGDGRIIMSSAFSLDSKVNIFIIIHILFLFLLVALLVHLIHFNFLCIIYVNCLAVL